MPQRLGFLKSRRGCKRCKQRRVKCDELVPCSTCARRDEQCSLLDPTEGGSLDTYKGPVLLPGSHDWTVDLELMHHYTTLSSSFGVGKHQVHLWQDYIPKQAVQHPTLMHGLLAFSSLHLASTRPNDSSKYLQLYDKHQGIALEQFRSILSSPIDPEHADALFALAATLSLSSMARSCALPGTEAIDMDSIAELFILTKGIANVLDLYRVYIEKGPLREMLKNAIYPSDTEVVLPMRVSSRFEAIRHMLVTSELDQEALEHCQNALTGLEEVYKSIVYFSPISNIEIGMVSRWQVWVSTGYVRLIQSRNAPALIILAYYAAAITAVRTAWYTRNWAEYTLRGISQSLEQDMQQWIQWPMEQVQERLRELGAVPATEESNFSTHSRVYD